MVLIHKTVKEGGVRERKGKRQADRQTGREGKRRGDGEEGISFNDVLFVNI